MCHLHHTNIECVPMKVCEMLSSDVQLRDCHARVGSNPSVANTTQCCVVLCLYALMHSIRPPPLHNVIFFFFFMVCSLAMALAISEGGAWMRHGYHQHQQRGHGAGEAPCSATLDVVNMSHTTWLVPKRPIAPHFFFIPTALPLHPPDLH